MHTITQLAPEDIPAAAEVIRQAFATVAEAFDLTEENCPTSGAFLRDAALAEELDRGAVLYGLSDGDGLSGCMSLKRKDGATFYLEKLAVAPWSRNRDTAGRWWRTPWRKCGGPEAGRSASGPCTKTGNWCAGTSGMASALREPGSSRTCRSWCVLWNGAYDSAISASVLPVAMLGSREWQGAWTNGGDVHLFDGL